MKISLIICAFNEQDMIGKCLDSAIANYDDRIPWDEIIIVDNNSKDATYIVANNYKKFYSWLNIKIITEPIQGLSHARQRGFQESTGDILVYIDADTLINKEWFNRVEHEFFDYIINDIKESPIVAVSGSCIYYDVSPLTSWLVKHIWWNTISRITYWWTGYMIMGSGFAIKRDVVEKMGGIPIVEFYGEDAAIAKAASKYGKVKFLFDLELSTSGRRLNRQGFFRTAITYAINYLFPGFTQRHIDYR